MNFLSQRNSVHRFTFLHQKSGTKSWTRPGKGRLRLRKCTKVDVYGRVDGRRRRERNICASVVWRCRTVLLPRPGPCEGVRLSRRSTTSRRRKNSKNCLAAVCTVPRPRLSAVDRNPSARVVSGWQQRHCWPRNLPKLSGHGCRRCAWRVRRALPASALFRRDSR